MNADSRTILLLAAEALRVATLKADKAKHLHLLADALDRIAGAGQERVMVLEDCEGDDPRFEREEDRGFGPVPDMPWETTTLDPRFTPNSGKCWRCGGSTPGGSRVCVRCWHESPVSVRTAGDKETFEREVRAWIEAEERGEKP